MDRDNGTARHDPWASVDGEDAVARVAFSKLRRNTDVPYARRSGNDGYVWR